MYEVFEKLCKEKDVTPYKVAKATGINTSTLSNWKAGRSTPKTDKLQKIADYFGVPLETFTSKRKPKTIVLKLPRLPFDNGKHAEKLQELIKGEAINLALEIIKEEFPKRLEEAIDSMLSDYEWELLACYAKADPGTRAAVRKLLDIQDEDTIPPLVLEQDDDEMPVAAHGDEDATPEELAEDAGMVDND